MQTSTQIMDRLGVNDEVEIVTAHHTPDKFIGFYSTSAVSGIQLLIAGAFSAT